LSGVEKVEYSVKQLAEKMGITEHTVRYYTDKGLLPCKRDNANRRVFDDESINWLIGIKCLKGCGTPLEDIKRYVDLCLQGNSTLQERYEIILKQEKRAAENLEEAKSVYEYMMHKVKHYENSLNRQIPGDTNPATWGKNPPKKHFKAESDTGE